MKTRIHVNQHNIRANSKGSDLPVLTAKTYKTNTKANHLDLILDGQIVASVIYSPDKPLDCGAKVWIETELEIIAK